MMIDSTRRAAATALLAAAIAVEPAAAAAEPLRLAPETARAFRQFDDATARLGKAKAALAAIAAGEKPKGTSRDWAGLPAAFEAAAASIKDSEGPILPDAAGQPFPQDELRDCATRQAALGRLERQLRGLHSAMQRSTETRALLRDRVASAGAAGEVLRAMVKSAGTISGAQSLREYFTWSWAELEIVASRTLVAYVAELRRQQERLDKGISELRARASTGAGLASSYGEAKDCLLAGRWVGSRYQGGAVIGLAVHLIASGSDWTGTVNYEGQNVPLRSVTMHGSNVSIAVAGGNVSFHGTVSSDGRTFRGTFSSLDGPASFTLRKQ